MKLFTLFLLLVSTISCNKITITPPPIDQDTSLNNTLQISDSVLMKMEGVYALVSGSKDLGTEFVCRISKYKISFFSNTNGIYIILQYGYKPQDSSIHFAGFWRYSENTTQGQIYFSTSIRGKVSDIISQLAGNLRLNGGFSVSGPPSQAMILQYERPFSQYCIEHEFMIFAHHGVQTTDDPPYTENSLKGAIHAQEYGVNGLEFDVQLTRDHIPICAHDADISTRVTEKGPITGDYTQYSFAFLDSFVRLSDGEKVPSVEQVLNAFIDSTSLKYMWLDVKGDPGIFEYLEPIVRKAYSRASKANRQVIIFADLTSAQVIAEFKAWPSYSSLPTICETSLDDVIQNHCQYWGPRYSLGLLTDDVAKAHSLGIKVLSWTLNDESLIQDYLSHGNFDGFITDYPSYVVYNFYTMF